MNAREVLASVTGYCDACGAGPGVVCDPFCLGVVAQTDECSCAYNADRSVTRMLCPLHAEHDPCVTLAAVTDKRRLGSIVGGVCSACGWMCLP